MVPRYKKMGDQLGKEIPEPGAHLSHAAVGILRKMRTKKYDLEQAGTKKGGSKVKPIDEHDPFPREFER